MKSKLLLSTVFQHFFFIGVKFAENYTLWMKHDASFSSRFYASNSLMDHFLLEIPFFLETRKRFKFDYFSTIFFFIIFNQNFRFKLITFFLSSLNNRFKNRLPPRKLNINAHSELSHWYGVCFVNLIHGRVIANTIRIIFIYEIFIYVCTTSFATLKWMQLF